jgi:sugar phosphate isomerase/epimerase
MKLALATPTPEVTATLPLALLSGGFEERLEKAARLGYDGVELLAARPHDLNLAAIRDAVAKAGLEIAAIASGALYMMERLTLLAADASVMQAAALRLHDLIDMAAQVGSPLVTVGGFRGRLVWAGGGERAHGILVEGLRKAAECAAQHGIRLVLEPLNRYETDILQNTEQTLAFLEEVGCSNIGLLLDTFHANIEEPSLTECFRQGARAGRLWHVHIGDSNRLAPGRGHLDFGAIVGTLQEVGYQGYLSAELLPQPDPDAAAAQTIRHMREWLPTRR